MEAQSATILVCTYNAHEELKRLLTSWQSLQIPPNWKVDGLVVDNGNILGTEELVASFSTDRLPLRYLPISTQGKCFAANRAIEQIESDVIVCNDEDIVVKPNWLSQLLGHIENGASAVTGPIEIAPHLKRPWMTTKHLEKLAVSTDKYKPEEINLIGANMALRRSIFEVVPQFNEDLGPGRLGCNEDTLYSLQLKEAGIKVDWAPEAAVEHHFKAGRLLNKAWLKVCYEQGQCNAYLDYHWSHEEKPSGALAALKVKLGFWKKHLFNKPPEEGVSEYDMDAMSFLGYEAQLKAMQGQPRKYAKRGLKLV